MFPDRPISEGTGVHASLGRAAAHSCTHAVHFYEDETPFLDSLGEFVGGALGAGGACVIVATEAHRRGLADRLASFGIDRSVAAAQSRYIALDARETLDRILLNGWPDAERFLSAIEPSFQQARSAIHRDTASRDTRLVVAFGEMVALLHEEGRVDAAVRLEQLWNDLARRHAFSLRCAYPIRAFDADTRSADFRRICDEHTAVIPSESFTRLSDPEEQWRMVGSLQQQASILQTALELRQREIEQRLRVEEKLRSAEEFARVIVDSSADCVSVLGLDGRIQFMNTSGCRALGIGNLQEGIGRRWIEFWTEADRSRAEAALQTAASGAVGSFQAECAPFAGTVKLWDVKVTPARGPRGRIESLIAVSRDITELRIAQTAAIHAEKLATAGRMAATIAHEINNPLEAVTNFIYLAQCHPGVPAEVRQHLEMADRELTRVAHIARQTLGFYRSTSSSRWIAVSDLIRDALMIYERRLRNKDIQVEISVHPDLQIYAKDGELRQAILNLTANAIDACAPGGRIWLRAQKTKKWPNGMEDGIRFTLADNGAGMPPEVQRRLFVPFFTTKAEVGTGIGLWVTRSLIEQRGGYMHFRSRQGERAGTVMSFFLPTGRPESAASAA